MGRNRILNIQQVRNTQYLVKWLFFSVLIGILAGAASAGFLLSLEWAEHFRDSHIWMVWLLPVSGFVIGASYFYWGQDVVKGNNQILDELHEPKTIIPLKMAPLVYAGTVLTHLFGGSAGREGTAVQMGASLSDQLTKYFKLKNRDRQMILIAGVSAGFASVFGTPLAGAVFALEVLIIGRMRYEALVPSLLSAVIADYVCHSIGAHHTHYTIPFIPDFTFLHLVYAIVAGICFGLGGMLFSRLSHFFSAQFARFVKYPPLRPVIGGAVIALSVFTFGAFRYIGLGVPVIVDAFSLDLPWYDCFAKLLYTTFTLGAGFKGGEVTPLFYIGATMGNGLSEFLPLPVALLAGMGFVGVFSGATNTPIACTLMGIELFGAEAGAFLAVSCVVAYLFSGHSGIYGSQRVGSPKHSLWLRDKEQVLSSL